VSDLAPPAKKPKNTGPGWLATYGDLVTLLMAFFVMLFAISSVEQVKFEAFLSGLAQFGNPAAQNSETANIGEPVADGASKPIPPILAAPEPLREMGRRVQEALAEAGLAGSAEIQYDDRGLAIVVGTDDVLFASGSARVTERGRAIIAAIAPELTKVSNQIAVEGHTDTVPLNRNGYTNWNLSTDRAVAVVNRLAGDHGVAPRRLTASGHGEYVPRDAADTADARRRNRRVEIVILTGKDGGIGTVTGPGQGAASGGAGTGGAGTGTTPDAGSDVLIEDPIGPIDIRPNLGPS
jgi:chemotaxis protein MotB